MRPLLPCVAAVLAAACAGCGSKDPGPGIPTSAPLSRAETRDVYRPPADGCASYEACFAAMAELEADTHLHIHKENNVLFPVVLALDSRGNSVRR